MTRIRIHGVDKSAISMEGTLSLDQILDDANLSASDDGINLKEGFEKGSKQYKGAEKVVKGLKGRVEKERKKIDAGGEEPWWYETASGITTVAKYVPYAAGIIGFINAAFFSDDETSQKPLKFEGSLSLNGTIEQEQFLFGEDFIFNPNAPLSSEYYRVVQDIPVGIFNLVNPITLVEMDCLDDSKVFTLHNPIYPNENRELNYVLNPNCGLNLISMKAAFVYEDEEPTDWYKPELFSKMFFQLDTEHPSAPIGVGLELVFQTKSSTRNTSQVKHVLKVYPWVEHEYVNETYSMIMTDYAMVRVGYDITFSNNFLNSYQYYIAHNNIIFNNGSSINVSNSASKPFYYFLAGNSIKLHPGTSYKSNNSLVFKTAIFSDLQLKSSSLIKNNKVENILYSYEPDFMSNLDFKNLELKKSANSTAIVNSSNEITAIKEEKTIQIKLFPNPTPDIVNIEISSNKEDKCKLFIYSNLGQFLYGDKISIKAGLNNVAINTNNLSFSGKVLFYKIVTSDLTVYSGKIILNN